MRLRKELDEMQEKDILLIAKISDALAHLPESKSSDTSWHRTNHFRRYATRIL